MGPPPSPPPAEKAIIAITLMPMIIQVVMGTSKIGQGADLRQLLTKPQSAGQGKKTVIPEITILEADGLAATLNYLGVESRQTASLFRPLLIGVETRCDSKLVSFTFFLRKRDRQIIADAEGTLSPSPVPKTDPACSGVHAECHAPLCKTSHVSRGPPHCSPPLVSTSNGRHPFESNLNRSIGTWEGLWGGADHTPSETSVAQSPSHGRVFTGLSVTSGPLSPLASWLNIAGGRAHASSGPLTWRECFAQSATSPLQLVREQPTNAVCNARRQEKRCERLTESNTRKHLDHFV